jgi:hypothetical protein
MGPLNESTYRLLITALRQCALEMQEMAIDEGKPLNYRRLSMSNKAIDLARMAEIEARNAGIPMDTPAGGGS